MVHADCGHNDDLVLEEERWKDKLYKCSRCGCYTVKMHKSKLLDI